MARIKFNSEEERKARKKETTRLWYLRNREKCLEVSRKWTADNKDRANETARRWTKNNLERRREIALSYYYRNHQECIEKTRKRREENPGIDKEYAKKYRQSPNGKKSAKKNYISHKHKNLCRAKVNHAIRDGKLERGTCHCGEIGEAHHEDYTKPFDIIWLCRKHHAEHHRRYP